MIYRPEIDGIRAIAVSAVILSHAGAALPGGFLGVDVFFVLSGFLITQMMMRELLDEHFSLIRFYERRVRRILPALFLMVLVSVPVAFWLMPPVQMVAFERSIVALMLFATNVKYYFESGYFAPTSAEIPLLHTWSLAVEEQFYVFFPLILLATWRVAPRATPLVFGALALTSLVAAELVAQIEPKAAFYLLPFRAWELLTGAMAGYFASRYGLAELSAQNRSAILRTYIAQILSFFGLSIILASFIFVDDEVFIPGFVVIPTITGTVALLVWARPGTLVFRILSARVMVWLGLISYSAYLWHQPIFAFARLSQIGAPSGSLMVLLIGITLLLGYLSWRFVEQPFRDRVMLPSLPMFVAVATSGTVILAMGVAGHFGFGVGSLRFSQAEIAAMKPITAQSDPFSSGCRNRQKSSGCLLGEGSPRLAVWGDSHSEAFAAAVAELATKRGESVAQFTRRSCPPALTMVVDRVGCQNWNTKVLAEIEATDSIETVILIWRHAYYLFGEHEAVYPNLPDDPSVILSGSSASEKRSAYWQSFGSIVRGLQHANKKVIIVGPVPELGAPILRLMVHYQRYDDNLPGADFHYYQLRNQSIIPRLFVFDAKVVLPATTICRAPNICLALHNGKALYYDIDHLSLEGGRYVVEQQLKSALFVVN